MRNAFSLVELSIVLVILGLLTGGILAGQSLIRAAETRAVTSEFMRYKTAIGTFRDKYFAIPGDMSTATNFWGTAAACPGIFSTAAGGTCNGDGNGQLSASASTANEIMRSWQHLGLAGLIEGSYTGTSASGAATTVASVAGQNIPASKFSNAAWTFSYLGPIGVSSASYFDNNNYGNIFQFGYIGTGTWSSGTVLKPEEAWNIDTKLDDGKPATGMILSYERDASAAGTGCSDTASSITTTMAASAYSLANSSQSCALIFATGY